MLTSESRIWGKFETSDRNLKAQGLQRRELLQQGRVLSRKLLRGGEQEKDLYSTVGALSLVGIKQHTYAFGKGEPIKHTWRCLEGCDRN